ncbi:Aste57867_20537 [Aphanomyces stellatus]|uniref:RBR-type E3 ubiquitin transferase n=1 Tax=Aphanomyces stellatus TaxID=120398 RepID=A0A485LFT8_9STRA|nr:hypothetical protein As57867_020470 [Aphanomyces stellatus]VFT97222.1 Aste57867_20537 [Aphanomyces stellatus]
MLARTFGALPSGPASSSMRCMKRRAKGGAPTFIRPSPLAFVSTWLHGSLLLDSTDAVAALKTSTFDAYSLWIHGIQDVRQSPSECNSAREASTSCLGDSLARHAVDMLHGLPPTERCDAGGDRPKLWSNMTRQNRASVRVTQALSSTAAWYCAPHVRPSAAVTRRTCASDGTWTPTTPRCLIIIPLAASYHGTRRQLPQQHGNRPHKARRMETKRECVKMEVTHACLVCLDTVGPIHNGVALDVPDMYMNDAGWRLRCGHVFCIGCLRQWIDSKVRDRSAGVVVCAAPSCRRVVRPSHVASFLAPDSTEQFSALVTVAALAAQSVYCPNATCAQMLVLPPPVLNEGRVVFGPQRTCPMCGVDMCTACNSVWHDGIDCAAYQRQVAAAADARLVQDAIQLYLWQRCPKCNVIVERVSGCAHMTCRCGQHFCYKCGKACGADHYSCCPPW